MDTKGRDRGILKQESRSRTLEARSVLTPQPTTEAAPVSPQPSVDRLSVTWADAAAMAAGGNIIHLPSESSTNEVKFSPSAGDVSDDEDYSASLSVVLRQRRASVRRSRKGRARRPSSPFLADEPRLRRRSSVFTTSSGDTAISMEEVVTQEQIYENIHLHKEVLGSVKQQPLGMRRKLKIVHQAKAYIKRHEGQLQERLAQSKSTRDIYARFNILLATRWQQLKREAANTSNLLIPWELRIKEIESHFGSVVASYFTFLRWLFWVNLVIGFILLVFVIVPECLTANPAQDGERKTIMKELECNSTHLLTLWEFDGILKYSPIFYGYYSNIERPQYRMPLAYFLTGLVVYIYSFVAILRKMAENSRMSKLSEKEDECVFSWKLFTGWDYMIGNAETAHNRIASVVLGFKEALLEEAEKKKDARNWKTIYFRVLVVISVIILLVLSAYAVVTVVSRSDNSGKPRSWWSENETTVVITVITLTFPYFFEFLGLLEYYHPRKQLRLQLGRIMLLNLLNIYSLIFALIWKIEGMSKDLNALKPNLTMNATVITDNIISIEDSITLNLTVNCYEVSISCAPCNLPLIFSNYLETTEEAMHITTPLPFTISIETTKVTQEPKINSVTKVTREISNDNVATKPIAAELKKEPATEYLTEISSTSEPEISTTEEPLDIGLKLIQIYNKLYPYVESEENITDLNNTDYNVFGEDSIENMTSFFELNPSISGYLPATHDNESSIDSSWFNETFEISTDVSTGVTDLTTDISRDYTEFLTTSGAATDYFTSNYTDFTTYETFVTSSTYTEDNTRPSYTKFTNNNYETITDESTLLNDEVTTSYNDNYSELSSIAPVKVVTICPNITFNCTVSCAGKNVTQVFFMHNCTIIEKRCYTKVCKIVNHSNKTMFDIVYEDEHKRKMYNLTKETKEKLIKLCWETRFGQELVKLTVMDLVFFFLGTLFLDFFRALLVKYMNRCWCWDLEKKFPKYGDFKIAENILHLINNQGLVWMGMFFSPGLVVLNVFKLMIMMYLRSWAVMTCNVPHEVVFRVSKSNNFYLALLLTMLFLCVLPVGYTIVWVRPSWHCGPFSEYEKIYHILTDNIYKILPTSLNFALEYTASPAMVIPLLVLLILIIYYLTSLTNSLREANNDLKIQLRRERTEERRKMFQLADTKRRSGSAALDNTPFARWKKALPSLPMGKSIDSDDRKGGDETIEPLKSTKKKGGIFAKIVGLALDKKSDVEVVSEVNQNGYASSNNKDDETDTDFHESLPKEVLKIKDITIVKEKDDENIDNKTDETLLKKRGLKTKAAKVVDHREKGCTENQELSKNKNEKSSIDSDDEMNYGHEKKLVRNQTSESSQSKKSEQSIASVIPVITISTTESDEEVLAPKKVDKKETEIKEDKKYTEPQCETSRKELRRSKNSTDLKSLTRQSSVDSSHEHKIGAKDNKTDGGHKYQYSL